jgi:hypothetical protein
MDGRQELLAYLGASLATIAALFGAQFWYESYLDVAVVHAQNADAPMNDKLAAVRSQEQQKLGASALPIDGAKQALAQRGRSAFPRITPKPSDDLSAMSGWINRPGFAAYVPRALPVQAAPAADGAAQPPAAEGVAAPAAHTEVPR